MDLSGCWKIDVPALGEQGEIQLPGIMQAQGYGEKITKDTDWISSLHDSKWYLREEFQYAQETQVNVPFLTQPKLHFTGVAQYTKEIEITDDTKEYVLFLERTGRKTQVFIDGTEVSVFESLCVPHTHKLGGLSKGKHTLMIQVDNSVAPLYRPDGHGVTDGQGATWNGIVGRIELQEKTAVYITSVHIKYPDSKICETEQKTNQIANQVVLCQGGMEFTVEVNRSDIPFEIHVENKENGLWSEFHPNCSEAIVELTSQFGTDTKQFLYGRRKIAVENGMFTVNHHPIYLRGTHFGGDFPLSMAPDCSLDGWRKIMKTVKEWGLNFIRFHSWCPPEAAFTAADEAGVYLNVECGMWNQFGPQAEEMLERAVSEGKGIIDAFGNHPSFFSLSPSNEPGEPGCDGGTWYEPLSRWYETMKAYDSGRIYTQESGWPYPLAPSQVKHTDFLYFHRSGVGEKGGTIRNFGGFRGKDFRKALEGCPYPVVCHELGQWCSYPDFSIIDKFTGVKEGGNFRVFKESARAHKVLEQNKDFVQASGKLQVAMYKEELEANFRTPHMYGFELLDLRDYTGQGGALIGILDVFMDSKGYVTPKEWKQFCGPTVFLARMDGYVHTTKETEKVSIEVSHFDEFPIEHGEVCWDIIGTDGTVWESGTFSPQTISLGKNQNIGEIMLSYGDYPENHGYELRVGLKDSKIMNSWKFWVYPPAEELEDICYTQNFETAKKMLEEGKSVLFNPRMDQWEFDCPACSFKPAFWNSQMGPSWARGCGMLIDSNSPAFAGFETEGYMEWQWQEVIENARGLRIEELPKEVHVLAQPIDEWNRNDKMAMILEATFGKGKLLLVTTDMDYEIEKKPSMAALKKSLINYVHSNEFQPQGELSLDFLTSKLRENHGMEAVGARITCTSGQGENLEAMLDGNPNSFARVEQDKYPFTFEITMEKEKEVDGFTYISRQNHRGHEGDVREYRLEICDKEGRWKCIQEGSFASGFEPKKGNFSPVFGKKFRFTALSGFDEKSRMEWRMEADGWHKEEREYPFVFAASVFALHFIEEETWDGQRKASDRVHTATKEIDD